MKTKKLLLLKNVLSFAVLLIFFASSIISVHAGDDKITLGEKITIYSKSLDEDRNILVYLPAGYDLMQDKYPVMYLLDGGAHFLHTSGIVQFLSTRGKMPQMIVVAIVNIDRSRDFSPTVTEKIPTSGGAEKFLGFLSEELQPYVDKNYRTQPYKILVGHSFGGTFATYTLLNKPEAFNAYISISPYLAYDDNYLIKQTELKLKSSYNHGVNYFMTLGDEPKYVEPLDEFTKTIESKSPEGLNFEYVQFDNEDHGTVPHLSIYKGLESIYTNWQIPNKKVIEGLTSLDAHYKKLSDTFGYTIATPEAYINNLGYYYLGNKEYDDAIKTFKTNVDRYPNSANVYDSLGEAYEKNGENESAITNYSKAVELASKQKNHPFLQVYKDNLKRTQSDVAEK